MRNECIAAMKKRIPLSLGRQAGRQPGPLLENERRDWRHDSLTLSRLARSLAGRQAERVPLSCQVS